jgi:hypothetical protein
MMAISGIAHISDDLRGRTFVITGGHTESFLDLIMKAAKGFAQSAQMGALPEIYTATGPVEPGGYYSPKRLRGYPRRVQSNAKSRDLDVAGKLWELSEQLTGVKYPM